MKKLIAIAAIFALSLSACGQNLLREDFMSDGMGGIIDWTPAGGSKYSIARLDSTGPDGMPVLRFERTSGIFVQALGFVLDPQEQYGFSVYVRTKGLTEETDASAILQALRTNKQKVVLALPPDTGGEWQKIEWTGVPPESKDNLYYWRFSFTGRIPKDGYIDICNPVFEPLTPKGAANSSKRSTNGKYVGRIVPVNPEMCRIDSENATMEFYYPDRIDTMAEPYFLRAQIGDAVVETEFDANHRATAVFGAIPEGDLTLRAELVGKQTGGVLRANEYRGKAIKTPKNVTTGRKLNNFVTEIWTKPLDNFEQEIVLGADRFVYICTDRLYKGVVVKIDGKEVLTDSKEGLPEAMRHLAMGTHRISIEGVNGKARKGTVSLRFVKVIGSTALGNTTSMDRRFIHYKYGEEYFRRLNLLDGYNLFISDAKHRNDPKFMAVLERELAKGVMLLDAMPLLAATHPCRQKYDEYKAIVEDYQGFQAGHSVLFHENKIVTEARMKYNDSEIWWNLNLPGKNLGTYIEDGNHCQFKTPEFDIPTLAGYANSGSGNNWIVEESYYATYPTEELVEKKLDFIRQQALDRQALVPTSMAHTVFLFNGWMRFGSWSRWLYPQMDAKAYYGKILQMMATDPAFENIGGVSFSQPSCDEDLMRFVMDAFRYYCIEGNTGDFAALNGLELINRHIVNGEFDEKFKGWTRNVATEKGLYIKNFPGFGIDVQRRCADRTPCMTPDRKAGDNFVVLAPEGNTISQTITGLQKGRLYQLEFCSFDYNQLMSKKKMKDPTQSAIEVKLEGKLLEYPEMTQIIPRKSPKSSPPCTVITHRLVFRAKGDSAVMTFSNNGFNKHKWGFNFVGVRPYYVKNEAEFKTILRLYIESDPPADNK